MLSDFMSILNMAILILMADIIITVANCRNRSHFYRQGGYFTSVARVKIPLKP